MESVLAITRQELAKKLDAKRSQFVESKTINDPRNVNDVDHQQQRQRRRDVNAATFAAQSTQEDLSTNRLRVRRFRLVRLRGRDGPRCHDASRITKGAT